MQTVDTAGSSALPDTLLLHTTSIVSAFVGHNNTEAERLGELIKSVYSTVKKLSSGEKDIQPQAALTPAVPIRKSVFSDHIICLEDGKRLKMLKRHLKISYNMTPEEYRAKWQLPHDYPMVAPDYAMHRSSLAKQIGLGLKPRVEEAPTPAPGPAVRHIPEGKSGRRSVAA